MMEHKIQAANLQEAKTKLQKIVGDKAKDCRNESVSNDGKGGKTFTFVEDKKREGAQEGRKA